MWIHIQQSLCLRLVSSVVAPASKAAKRRGQRGQRVLALAFITYCSAQQEALGSILAQLGNNTVLCLLVWCGYQNQRLVPQVRTKSLSGEDKKRVKPVCFWLPMSKILRELEIKEQYGMFLWQPLQN